MKSAILFACLIAAVGAGNAAAIAPTLLDVSSNSRRPTATFLAPGADFVAVYVASRPDRATNGEFFTENVETLATLTPSEIQAGYWTSASKIDPGQHWVMVNASPSSACWISDTAMFNPACADGYSEALPLVVPKPRTRFTASSTLLRFLGHVYLQLTATPLGERVPYRVCYRNAKSVRRCVSGVLAGFSWDYSADSALSVRTRNLRRVTTFTWYARGRLVATRRVVTR